MVEFRIPALTSWAEKAVCKGLSHLFYSDFSERPSKRIKRENAAKAICGICPVIQECRQYAHNNPEYGVWGGETEEERFSQGLPVPAGSRSQQRRRNKIKKKVKSNV